MDKKFYENYEAAADAYMEYITTHINNVVLSWTNILRPWLEKPENMIKFDDATIGKIDIIHEQIEEHDKSKLLSIEFVPYRNNFYPTCEDDLNAYNQTQYDLAWLHHQNVNTHHYQYWILHKDSGETKILDMDFASICEMLCDWHSFSAKYPESTCDKWYTTNKDKMMLSDNTKKTIELLLPAFIGKGLSRRTALGSVVTFN